MQLVGIMWIKVAPIVATIFQLKHAISVYEFWRGLLSVVQGVAVAQLWCWWWQKGPITSEIHIRQHILWSFGVAARNFFSFVPKKAVLEEDMLDSSWGMAPPASSIRVDQLMRKQSTIVPRLLLSVVMLLNIS